MRRTRKELVTALEAQGLYFRTFDFRATCPHAVQDCDWNQRDLPHVRTIHGGFSLTTALLTDDMFLGTYLQNIFGLRVPLSVAYYHLDVGRVSQTSAFGFVLISEAQLLPSPDGGSIEHTTYSVGTHRWLSWSLPLLERMILRNARRLQQEDEPVRQRRTQLRSWGFRMEEPAGYERSTHLDEDHVTPPEDTTAPTFECNLSQSENEFFLGRDDHHGVRVVREGNTVRIFSRMCFHEGASLDKCSPSNNALACPWHGRRSLPIASFDLSVLEAQTATGPHHHFELKDRLLRVQCKP